MLTYDNQHGKIVLVRNTTHIRKGVIKMMNKTVKVTFKDGKEIQGLVYDVTACGRYIHIETKEDFYCIDTKFEAVEEVVEAEEVLVPASHEVQTTIKEAISQIAKDIKWSDDYSLRIAIQDCIEDGIQSYEIELHGTLDDERYDGFNFETFGDLKKAQRRAKTIIRNLSKQFEISEDIEVYAC